MQREKLKWMPHESESTEAGHRGGVTHSSEEVFVMGMERRGYIVQSYKLINLRREESLSRTKPFEPMAER